MLGLVIVSYILICVSSIMSIVFLEDRDASFVSSMIGIAISFTGFLIALLVATGFITILE